MGKNLKGRELGDGITQRKDGQYMARFKNRFGERQCLYNQDLKQLKRDLDKAKYEDRNFQNLVYENIILDEWFEKWFEIYKIPNIKENTKRYYLQVYNKHIHPVLGKYKIKDITHLQIRTLINNLKKQGLKSETQNKVKVLLVDMYDKAIIDNFANRNPAKGITISKNDKKDIRVLTIQEQMDFFECCKGTFYDNLFVTAVTTGLRIGELCALTENDIDFANKTININKTLIYQKFLQDDKKQFHIGKPKTESSNRIIPMNKQCELALKKQVEQKKVIANKNIKAVDKEFNNLLFTTRYNTPINNQIISDAITKIIREINLRKDTLEEIEVFSSHCFRHTFATRCFEAGILPKAVQQYLGHSSINMTMDLYTHVLEEKQKSEMYKFTKMMDNIFNINDNDLVY